MANINIKTEGLNKVLEVSKEVLVSDAFSESTSYTAGQFCIYNNKLYKFTANKTAGAWDSTKVTETRVDNEITSINTSLAKIYNLGSSGESNDFTFNASGLSQGIYIICADRGLVNCGLMTVANGRYSILITTPTDNYIKSSRQTSLTDNTTITVNSWNTNVYAIKIMSF